ncbi:MAG: hypothetical protein N4A76_02910 [Firmicutes bacterium]|jgi:hypothetical protein|nr:hypothetical protein [Bacillota bacterium]
MKNLHILFLTLLIILTGCGKSIDLTKADELKESLYPTERSVQINGKESLKYFVLKNDEGEPLPVIVQIDFKIKDELTDDLLLNNLEHLGVRFFGINNFGESSEMDRSKFEYTKVFMGLQSGTKELTAHKSEESVIAYLKKEFPDKIKIKSVDDDYIRYEMTENTYTNCLIAITRDPEGVIRLLVQ